MFASAEPPFILIVEDEDAIRGVLTFTLSRSGFFVSEAVDCASARDQIDARMPDLVVLDWMLPDSPGVELLRELRRNPRTRQLPVVLLTAKTEEADKITGLKSGADDYVTKPFSRQELLLRIEAVLRRCQQSRESERLEFGQLVLDSVSYRATIESRELSLGRVEFRLLRFLMSNPDRVFSRAQLLDKVWQTNGHVEERTVDVHVMRIRAALGRSRNAQCIQTVRGLGYRFSPTILLQTESGISDLNSTDNATDHL